MKTTLHIILIAALSLFSKLTYSQVFTDLNSQLPGLESGSAAWADYDNDGDLDLAMAGFSSLVAERSFIFRNDNGIMNPVDSSIIKVSNGSVNWADFDNDGDMDLLINGQNNGTPMCELYRNDSLTFVPMNPGFVRTLGCMKWLDIDNDGFQDVLIAGVGLTQPSFIATMAIQPSHTSQQIFQPFYRLELMLPIMTMTVCLIFLLLLLMQTTIPSQHYFTTLVAGILQSTLHPFIRSLQEQ